MIDKVDIEGTNYNDALTEQGILEEKHNMNIAESVIPLFSFPSLGYIVEYGSWRGSVIDILSKLYGTERVLGFDISNFTDHPQIHAVDVRLISGNSLFKMPIALAWNDLSEWNGSPAGKQAAFDHAMNNMVNDGIFIEHKKCPEYIHNHPNLTLIHNTKHLLFFRYNE